MATPPLELNPWELPAMLQAVPVQPASSVAGLEICFLLRHEPDPVSGPFVLIRQTLNARVVLGCLRDAGGRVLEWLELYLQRTLAELAFNPLSRGSACNRSWDLDWESFARETEVCDPFGFFATPWAFESLRPVRVSPDGTVCRYLTDTDGAVWTLCHDASLLAAVGAGPYGEGDSRYLVSVAADRPPRLALAVSQPADTTVPEDGRFQVPIERVVEPNPEGQALCWTAPRLLVRRVAPVSLLEYLQMLDGTPWRGIENGKQAVVPGGVYSKLSQKESVQTGAAHLLGGRLGQTGVLLEVLLLKLMALRQMLDAVSRLTRLRQTPLLNLNEASFAVRFGQPVAQLPLFWSAQLVLVEPGDAEVIEVPGTGVRVYQRRSAGGASVYQPESMNGVLHGVCSFRLLRVSEVEAGAVVDATVVFREMAGVSPNSLIWIQLPLAPGTLELYGHVSRTPGGVPGEVAFRSLPLNLGKPTAERLHAAAGASLNHVPFAMLPPVSSPVDLYALAVLATRMLLANAQTSLPFALDALLKLAPAVSASQGGNPAAGVDVARVLFGSADWLAELGPHRLVSQSRGEESPEHHIPAPIWGDTLAFVLKMFPGQLAESFCRDLGDAPDTALHRVYDEPLREIDRLISRVKTALFCDWASNVEIAGLIQQVADES